MNKLTKNLIIGASATTAVAGGGAGAAVAFTHKDKDAKAENQAAQSTVETKPAVNLPGQDELKAAQSAQEHNMLNPNHVPEDKTTHISATDVKTEVPHAMEFFVPATFGDKVVEGSTDAESQAIRKDNEEKALAAAFKHAIETEDKSEHEIRMEQFVKNPGLANPMPILEREMVDIPAETFEVKAPEARFIPVDERVMQEGVDAQSIQFDVKAPEAKFIQSDLVKIQDDRFIPINEFHELQTARQELVQQAIDLENEKIERDMAVEEQIHQEKLAQEAEEQLAQENQEKLEEFVDQLNHEIHELKNEADNNADIAAELSSQVNKQGNVQMTSNSLDEESKAAQAAFDASKDADYKKAYVGETSGQSEYEASQQAHADRVNAEAGALAAAQQVQSVNKQGNVQSTSNFLDEESKAAQAAFDASKDADNKKTTYVGETSGQSEYEASQHAHEQRVAAEAGALAAKEAVASVDKSGNMQMTGQAIQGAEQADQMMLGAKVFAAQQAAEQKHELSRDEVARLDAGLIVNEDRGRDEVAAIEKQAAETAKNYALAEAQIEARLQQRHHEEVSHQVHAKLDDKKASSVAQEMYETQKHGAEVDAIRVAQEVFNRQRAEVEAELRGEARQQYLERSRDDRSELEGKKAQSVFDAAKTNDQGTMVGDKRSGQDDYEASQRAHAARIAGEAAAKEFAAEMAAAQQHAKEVEDAGVAAEKQVDEQIKTEVATQAVQYEQHKTEVAQVLETRELASIQKELDAAQVKLVADASRMGSTELTQNQMNELSTWRLVDRQEASKILPSNIVDKLFASKVVDQVNVSLSGNADSATLFAIAFSHGENADGSIGYAEFAVTKHHEQPVFQWNLQIGSHRFGNQQPQPQPQAPATQFIDWKANQVVYDSNNAGVITITNGASNGQEIDLFHPSHGIKVNTNFVNQLKANGVTSAKIIILDRGHINQGMYGANVRVILNGQETIHEVYFAIRTY